MILVYQRTGAKTGEQGDCFTACLASLFHLPMNKVPNFNEGAMNGQPLPAITRMAEAEKLRVCGDRLSPAFQSPHATTDGDGHAEYVLPPYRTYRHLLDTLGRGERR